MCPNYHIPDKSRKKRLKPSVTTLSAGTINRIIKMEAELLYGYHVSIAPMQSINN